MPLNIIFVITGFMLLIKGADYLVDGSSSIARRLGISTLVIGLTVVAFGTSAPELVVSILSAASGHTEMALGNINGSNIANILLILGITAFFAKVPVKSRTVIKEIPFMMLAGFLLMVLCLDVILNNSQFSIISRADGVILLTFFAVFMYYLWLSIKETGAAKVEKEKRGLLTSCALTLIGLTGLVFGGYLAVEGASGIAIGLGISETLVGLTIVAVGTSLPELVSAIVAARKNETDLAVGNVIGSNIFNILLILGFTSTITPIEVTQNGMMDVMISFMVMLIFLIMLLSVGRRRNNEETWAIDKRIGISFLLLYVSYIAYIVIRG